jgi:hypothetical protein
MIIVMQFLDLEIKPLQFVNQLTKKSMLHLSMIYPRLGVLTGCGIDMNIAYVLTFANPLEFIIQVFPII